MTGPIVDGSWMTDRREVAALAFYMASDGWDASEVARMVDNPRRYADLYVLAKTEGQLDGLASDGQG